MHKSSEHSDKDCVWNEDAPTVIWKELIKYQAKLLCYLRRTLIDTVEILRP